MRKSSMKTKHTPGPWGAFVWDKLKPHKIAIGASNAPGGADHVVYAEFLNGMADARLIAAAPEMLKALERCISALAANGAPNCEAAKEARAAIAKAKGF